MFRPTFCASATVARPQLRCRMRMHVFLFTSVAQSLSLAVEVGNRVAWSVANYSSDNLAVLFDSWEFFIWSEADNGYQIQDKKGGHVVPASPHTMCKDFFGTTI